MPPKQSQQNPGARGSSTSRPLRSGTLYVVAISIGHLDDVTIRAIRILREVDLIVSEDPKVTQPLLAHHAIDTTVTSYGPSHLQEKVAVLLHRLEQGLHVALISDCGSPLIADPGQLLVEAAHVQGIQVVAIPGPSALIAAMTISGLSGDSFFFLGQLPATRRGIIRCLTNSLGNNVPTIAFCTLHSAVQATDILSEIAPRRLLILACDVTKPNERVIRGTTHQIRARLHELQGRDVTLIIRGTKNGKVTLRPGRSVQSFSSRRIKIR